MLWFSPLIVLVLLVLLVASSLRILRERAPGLRQTSGDLGGEGLPVQLGELGPLGDEDRRARIPRRRGEPERDDVVHEGIVQPLAQLVIERADVGEQPVPARIAGARQDRRLGGEDGRVFDEDGVGQVVRRRQPPVASGETAEEEPPSDKRPLP